MAIQDCLYRNMPTSEWVIFNDIDEHIIPSVHKTWLDLIKDINQDNLHVAFATENAFFSASKLPQSSRSTPLTIEQNTLMTVNKRASIFRDKCIVRPLHIFEQGMHHVNRLVNASKIVFKVPINVALLHHYRMCSDPFPVKNVRALSYVDELRERMQFVQEWIKKLIN